MRDFTEEDRQKAFATRQKNKELRDNSQKQVVLSPLPTVSGTNSLNELQKLREQRMLRSLQENENLAIELENKRMREELTGVSKTQSKGLEFEMFDKFMEFYKKMNSEIPQEPTVSDGQDLVMLEVLKNLPQLMEVFKLKAQIPQEKEVKKEMDTEKMKQEARELAEQIKAGKVTEKEVIADIKKRYPDLIKKYNVNDKMMSSIFKKVKAGEPLPF